MTSLMSLSGPSRPPRSGGRPRQLVLLLHGLGADGSDLIELAPIFEQILPDAVFVAPDAPFPCDMAPMGRQWFSVQDRSPAMLLAGVRLASSILEPFIDEQLETHGLAPDRLVLIGFSQGTMMSLHVGLRRNVAPACILGYSGRLLAPELLADECCARPPVMLIHGDADEVVPFSSLEQAAAGLRAADVPVGTHVCRGVGHGIDEEGMIVGAQFLRRTVES